MLVLFASAATEGLRGALAFRVSRGVPIGRAWLATLRSVGPCATLGSLVFLGFWLVRGRAIEFGYAALVFPFAAFLQSVNMLYLVGDAVERINVQNALTIGAGSALATLVAVLVFHASVPVVLTLNFIGYVVASVWAALGSRALLRPAADAEPTAEEPLSERANLAFVVKGGASAIVTVLAFRVDLLVIGATLPKASLGIYTTALAVGELLYTPSRSITWATTGRIATASTAAGIALATRSLRTLLVVGSVIAVGLAIVGPPAIGFFYGDRFRSAGPLLLIALPRIVLYGADGLIAYFIASRLGRPGAQLAFEVGTLGLCAASTYAGLRADGLRGAALGATVAFALAFLTKLAYFVRAGGVSWRATLVPRYDDVPLAIRATLHRLGRRPRA